MPLSPGTRLGAYEIAGQLGAGGMGEVYRATDPRLKRDVAIKVLPQPFAQDLERPARFRREAELLASLNHPNIASIYGLEQVDGMVGIGLELVEGETLADLIARGPLALDEALPIGRQIAEALEAAHDRGVVHRDLKPANIKVTPDGRVKVLDFGLAKMLESPQAPSSMTMSPTLSVHATYAGMILGTAAYMSPEQARGKPVDRRTDAWAFRCVLYEMLTGKQSFEPGETVSDAIVSVLSREPDWSALPAATPSSIRRLLRRCLRKDPQQRLPHIGAARLDIDDARQPSDDEASGFKPGKPVPFLTAPYTERALMFSPDGRWLAYQSNESGSDEVYVTRYPGPVGKWRISNGGGATPTWSRTKRVLFYASPDNQIMVAAYFTDGEMFHAEKPIPWSAARFVTRLRTGPTRSFDLHPDGTRFAAATAGDTPLAATPEPLVFVFNFTDELRRIAPSR